MIYVLYHSNCYDGFGAAYAAWKKFGGRAQYLPVSYNKPVPELPGAKEVYIVDFSYDYDILDLIQRKYECSVTVLDHHKTAEEKLTNIENPNDWVKVVFDMNRSGALITWEYFHKDPAPLLIQHISDRDLWQFKMDGTAKIHKALVSYPMDFTLWDTFDVEVLKKEGVICERLYTNLVENIVSGSWIITDEQGDKCAVVNTSIAWSEVGQALLKKHKNNVKYAMSFTYFSNEVMYSLRSEGDFDVSEKAKLHGGGGHKNAAGYKVSTV